MGQVIDFVERRPRLIQQDPPPPSPLPDVLGPIAADYSRLMLAPSLIFWRSVMAGYAALWLAPLGLEVRVTDKAPDGPDRPIRATTRG